MIATRKRAPRIEDLIGAPMSPPSTSATDVLPRPELERLDRRLAELGRASGRWRLQLGDLLERFTRLGGPTHYGFSSAGAYGREHAGQTARWCDDSRALARRLEHFPLLRAALATGRLAWSMVELLSRHATPDSEAALLLASKGATVRAMKQALQTAAANAADAEAEADAPRERSVIQLTVPTDDAWAYEFVRILLDRGFGCRTANDAIEAMLAEASITLSIREPDAGVPLGPPEDMTAEWRHDQAKLDAEIEASLEHRVDLATAADLAPLPKLVDLPDNLDVLHRRIQDLAHTFAGRDLELGHTAIRFFAADGWRKLGFTSETQYARERVGCSLSALQQRMRLARGVDRMPAVKAALTDRAIGFESAMLILRRSPESAARAWVDRARERTVLGLRDELDTAGSLARVHGSVAYLVPPSAETVADFAAQRASVLDGSAFLEVTSEENRAVESPTQISGAPVGLLAANDAPPRRGTGMRTLRLAMDHDLARWWRRLERAWRVLGCGGDLGDTFVEFLCGAMVGAWLETVRDAQRVKYAHIYARDGYRCQCPVCDRRDVTPHHLLFRSRGGGEEDDNLVSVCSRCHLDLVHGGFIRAEGPASDVYWLLGRVPHMEVAGSVKRQAAARPATMRPNG